MKKIKKGLLYALTCVLIIAGFLYVTIVPIFAQKLKSFKGEPDFTHSKNIDSSKKMVFIMGENDGTEMFDLMAPFYLFNATEKASVYVVSEKKSPVLLVNSLTVLPHFSFAEIDSLHMIPDVIVIPNLNVHLMTPPRPIVVSWIRKHVLQNTIVLAICDGAATAAATGLYDGKPITTHASDFKDLKKLFSKPNWINNIPVTESGNLYSTAGVSNAVEGSLTVIKRVFGDVVMQKVLQDIRYPHPAIQTVHESKVVGTGAVVTIVSKTIFRKNYKLGVWINEGVNEFALAGLLDTYARTFPASLNTFSNNNSPVISRFGLTLYPTGDIHTNKVNELHLLQPATGYAKAFFKKANLILYDNTPNEYAIDQYLNRIGNVYGKRFKNCVKLTLDYN